MKRDEIKAIFPDATDDQITTLLNKHGAELEGWKTQYNTANDALTELQNKGNLDDVRAELETYTNKVADYEAATAKAAQEAYETAMKEAAEGSTTTCSTEQLPAKVSRASQYSSSVIIRPDSRPLW